MGAIRTNQLITDLLSSRHLKTASRAFQTLNSRESKLCFGIRALDKFFGGGISFGSLIESGLPLGGGGRRIWVQLLAAATSGTFDGQKRWCLWISAGQQPRVYPPAWQALGVDLKHLRFASSNSPLSDLKTVFLDNFFQVIVIDQASPLKAEEHVFLAQCARHYNKIIIVCRQTLLSNKDSNTSAKFRLNITYESSHGMLELSAIRGLHQNLLMPAFFHHHQQQKS